jgi:hypothetical protein
MRLEENWSNNCDSRDCGSILRFKCRSYPLCDKWDMHQIRGSTRNVDGLMIIAEPSLSILSLNEIWKESWYIKNVLESAEVVLPKVFYVLPQLELMTARCSDYIEQNNLFFLPNKCDKHNTLFFCSRLLKTWLPLSRWRIKCLTFPWCGFQFFVYPIPSVGEKKGHQNCLLGPWSVGCKKLVKELVFILWPVLFWSQGALN